MPVLVLKRKTNESITINGNIVVTILRTGRGIAHVAVNAPREVEVMRSEILAKKEKHSADVHSVDDMAGSPGSDCTSQADTGANLDGAGLTQPTGAE